MGSHGLRLSVSGWIVVLWLLNSNCASALRIRLERVTSWGTEVDVHAFDAQSGLVVAAGHDNIRVTNYTAPVALHLSDGPQPWSPEGDHYYGAFVVKALIILTVATALFFLYGGTHAQVESWTGIGIQHISCVVFMILSVSTDLSTKSAARRQGGHYAFNPAIAVVIVEACKLVISATLFGMTVLTRRKDSRPLELPDVKDVMVLTIPGVVYTCNNILVFEAIEKVPLATFAVVRETRLVWNALIWMALFKMKLGFVRWLAIAGVIIGCSANQVPGAVRSGWSWGVIYAFLLAFLNAAGGVVCEFAMKMKASMDINLQNSIIYASCSCLALLYLAAFRSNVFQSTETFFQGFAPDCLQIIVLQVITGLTVSRILKHVESVTKSMVAALCAPVICFLGSAALSMRLHWNDVLASCVVVISCLIFLRQGPLGEGQQKEKQAALNLKGHLKA